MDSQDPNPYAAPTSYEQAAESAAPAAPSQQELASRMGRLAARLIDGMIGMVINLPIMFATGYFDRAMQQQVGIGEMLAYQAFGFLVYLGIHGYFMATRGQTIGKMAMGIKMVDHDTGELLPLVKLVGLRDVPIMVIGMVPCVGGLVLLVGILMIFGQDKRCLHDLIANTKVVQA